MQTWRFITLSLSLIGTAAQAAPHSDWGYESARGNKPPKALTATPQRLTPGGFAIQGAKTSMLPTVPPLVREQDRQSQAMEAWLELYQLASMDGELTEEQQKLIQQGLSAKLMTGQKNEVMSVLEFWPTVKRLCELLPEQRENYRELFRALLRLQLRNAKTDKSNLSETIRGEFEAISQLLGAERIAVPGDPPLTEAAIKAYADMACFIFEQNHPGRTVDAQDNRTLFANVIAERFRTAPNEAARQAMLNFDLTWAKFRILWTKANAAERQQMLDQWNTGGAQKPKATATVDPSSGKNIAKNKITETASKPGVSDNTLAAVLNNGPWRNILLAKLQKPPAH